MPEYTMWLKIHIMDELLRETKKRMLFRSDGMIYVLEDEKSILELLVYTLNNSGLEAKGFSRPSEFWKEMKEVPDLLLLDIMLPEEDGLTILKKLRSEKHTKNMPVIMLTAKSSEYDKVMGLDIGADDYITKPFGMMELVARIKAVLRRTQKEETGEKEYQIGELFVALKQHVVKVGGISITLTSKEFELLSMFIENQSVVFSRDHILNRIWGYEFDGANRTVDVHIGTLRQKLGECGEYIKTVRGYGYKFEQSKEG